MTLALYFAKRFLVSFIRVFLGIVLLVLLFDFLTNLNRLNGIENQVWNALILSFLRTTTYLSLAMPLIIMLSTLAFSVSLSRSNEFIISRASGLSALRSIFSVLICAFILGLISIFILDPTAGRMIGYYDVKLDTLRSKKQSKVTINDNGYWMRIDAPSCTRKLCGGSDQVSDKSGDQSGGEHVKEQPSVPTRKFCPKRGGRFSCGCRSTRALAWNPSGKGVDKCP